MHLKIALQNVPLLNHLTDSQLADLAERGRLVFVGPEHLVFRAGDPADCLYIILSGRVKVFLQDSREREIVMKTLGSGEFFGELGLLDGGNRSASIATMTACEFFVLDRQPFFDLLGVSPQLLSQQFRELSRRIRDSNERRLREQIGREALRAEIEAQRHRALAQVVAGVAHEVNTPLGIVSTAVSVIKSELKSDRLKRLAEEHGFSGAFATIWEAAELMEKHITRAHGLIQSFKNISASQVSDIKESMSLSDAVREILELFEINARRAKLALTLEDGLSPEASTWVGYRGHLSRILLNLLTNIERYAYPDGKGGRVQLTLATGSANCGPCFHLVVRDFGVGMSADDLSRVFEPFFTTGRNKGGTGLGMAIVYSLVTEGLKGQITVDSELGQGTTVRITLPQSVPEHCVT